MNYLLHILVMICIYVILTLSLNLLVGYAGLMSLCHAAFYGIGAYVTTLLMTGRGINFFPAAIFGVFFAVLVSLVVSAPSLRLKGDYFVLAGIGFQVIIFSILYNWISLTRGPYGIPGIPRPSILGFAIDSTSAFFILALVVVLLVVLFFRMLYNSPFGLVLKSIREDELVAVSLGRNTSAIKTVAFSISAGTAAIAGSLYATYVTYIDPTSFTIDESIFLVATVLVGGSGNLKGPIIGTLFMIILPELLRFLGIPDTIAPNIRQVIYGLVLLVLMRNRPQGIAGEYRME